MDFRYLPRNALEITKIILKHNYVFDHSSVHILNGNDTTERIIALFNAGANITENESPLDETIDLDFPHPGLDMCVVRSIIVHSRSPRSLVGLARNCFKRAIQPCKTGWLQVKVDSFDIPYGVKKYIVDV